jgi:NAD(P)H-dependent FMN reductase
MTAHDPPREPVRFLVFAGSLRGNSINGRLAALSASAMEAAGAEVDHASMDEFPVPSYDGDLEQIEGVPEGAAELRRRLLASDGYVIASPEYNGSLPGALKNLIDWVSRFRPQPWHGRHGLEMSASPSMVGGNRGAWALRVPLEHLGSRVYPDMFSLARAHEAFGADGRLSDPRLQDRLESTLAGFIDLVEAAKHYPCVKRDWFEFLGERPEPVIDRVE